MFRRTIVSGVLAMLLGAASDAMAVQQAKSRYTTIDLAKCRIAIRVAGPKGWHCNGLPGYPVFVARGGSKTFLSVGRNGQWRRAAAQTLGAANTLFDGTSQRTAVEWRFVIRDKRAVPYATIVRYFTRSGAERGQVVIVTRVTETEACQVARIDALANSDAMMIARRVADQSARLFDCKREPLVEGIAGQSPM
jgi:hypothetical protein